MKDQPPPVPETTPTEETRIPTSRHASGGALLKETAIILVSALVLSLVIKTFLFQAFYIPSASMRDTLVEGDRVLVTKLAPGPLDVHRGDAVVFKDPGGWLPPVIQTEQSALRDRVTQVLTYVGLLPQDSGEHLIKRVIGLPGDRVASDGAGGAVTVNGVAISEPYLRPGSLPSEVVFEVVVPDGSLWVMGDNRQNSGDSRVFGAIKRDSVVGRTILRLLPIRRTAFL